MTVFRFCADFFFWQEAEKEAKKETKKEAENRLFFRLGPDQLPRLAAKHSLQ